MGTYRRLFREEAFARRGKAEPLTGLLRVTAPHEWVFLVCLGAAILGAAAWGVFGSIEQSTSAECLLAHTGDRYPIIADSSGYVVELLADVGDAVAAGQPIARIRSPELSREIEIARARVDILEAKDAKMADAITAARAELIELEALEAAGAFIKTLHAGLLTSNNLSIGQIVRPGAAVAVVRVGGVNELEAFAMVVPAVASDLAIGMEAHILTSSGVRGSAELLEAEVSHVAPGAGAPPHWLTSLGLSAPERSYLVRLALREAPAAQIADGDPCGLRIVLRRVSPVALLLSSGSN